MNMNRQMRRLSLQAGRQAQSKEWNEFKDVTVMSMSNYRASKPDSTFNPSKVFQNNKYIVFVFRNHLRDGKFYDKVMVRRSDAEPIYSWNDLYRIKNELFGPEIEAVQFMPKVSELVDDANLYWFFVEKIVPNGPLKFKPLCSGAEPVNGQPCPECGNESEITVDRTGECSVYECPCGQCWK